MTNASVGEEATIRALSAYYTPRDVARTIVGIASPRSGERILEPSVGDGALIRATIDRATDVLPRFVACDINPFAVASLADLSPFIDETYVGDFLSLSPENLGYFDVVLANPPFTRNHEIPPIRRRHLREKFEVRGSAGLWVYFVLHSMTFIRPGGRLVFIVPGAARFTDYGRGLLERLQKIFGHVSVTEFRNRIEWRGGASEHGSVLVARDFLAAPIRTERKVLAVRGIRKGQWAAGTVAQFGELAEVGIGAVTGRNSVFLLNSADRVDAGIALDDTIPTVSRAIYTRAGVISRRDLLRAADNGERVLMLRPRSYSSAVKCYLDRNVSIEDRDNVSWFRRRNPWWQIDVGDRCDAVFTYMSHLGPKLAIVGHGITCTNTLHRIRFKRVSSILKWSALLSIASTLGQLSAERVGRSYGGGVLKLEPSEVKKLPILLTDSISPRVVREARTVVSNGSDELREFADQALLIPFLGVGARKKLSELREELEWLRSLRLKK